MSSGVTTKWQPVTDSMVFMKNDKEMNKLKEFLNKVKFSFHFIKFSGKNPV